MFGYVAANRDALTNEQKDRYKSCYCGLCRTLKERHGSLSRLTLNYDMTFLVMLLSSLYEPEEASGSGRCIVHPVHKHFYWRNEYTDYASDMNIALFYHKSIDDWNDEHKLLSAAARRLLKDEYDRVKEQYPRQCEVMEQRLFELNWLEETKSANPDLGANYFGQIMGELFVYREDHWEKTLREMGVFLGRFIYVMDAVVDFIPDKKRGRYNPLVAFQESGGEASNQKDILTMLIGECAAQFEKLPLIQDIDILRNILYAGIWQRYVESEKKSDREEVIDDK